MIQPHALLPSGSPGVVMEPQADRQERACWARIEQQVPIPRWWYHPHAAAGVVALTHDEEGFGDRSRWMAEHEGSQLLRSTMFVIPGAMTAGGAMSILAEGADVQLHWNRGFFAQYVEQRLGFGPFRPLVRTRSLREQKEALLGLLPPSGQAVLLNRNHGLVWDPEWGKSFRILAAAGIAADSTYGPTGAGRFGYIFGTGLPFSPLDENGLPLPLHEVPFLFQDDEEYSIARQVELLERSEQGDHQLIVAIFHVNTMARVPSLERMHGWLELPRQARQHAHQVMDLGSFLRFWWDRARSPIRSSYQQGKLSIEVQALVEGLTLRLPERADGSTLWAIVVDGDRFPVAWAVRYAGAVLIPLSPGRHVLEVHYR